MSTSRSAVPIRSTENTQRRRIISLATALLAKAGPEGFSLRGLATQAGTSTQAVYTLFGGKNELLDVVYAEGCRKLHDAVVAVIDSDADPIGNIVAIIIEYRRFALAQPVLYALIFSRPIPGYRPSDAATANASAVFRSLVDAVAMARDAHRIGPGAPDDQELAERLWTYAHGAVSLERVDLVAGDTGARLAATVTDLCR